MERARIQEGGRAFFRELADDPLVLAGAKALTVGVTDPMAFLANAGDDWNIACAVVTKASELKSESRRSELRAVVDAIGRSVGYRVADHIGRMLG